MTNDTQDRPAIPAIPLPSLFQRHRPDPPPATGPDDSPRGSPRPTMHPPATEPAKDHPAGSPLPTLGPPAAGRTRTSATRRTPTSEETKAAAKVLGGLLIIGLGSAALWLRRNGRQLRQPTSAQVDDIATPFGRLLARYIPTEIITGALVDITEGAAATHAYVVDETGPLISRAAGAGVFNDLED